ncbi:MAG: hypothetical protein KGZ52_01450 [Xanthomonadaceae bacterium]|jgi:hypothetical protein|nr:hypothetical protein [Xanthomonadaceae bacterium]
MRTLPALSRLLATLLLAAFASTVLAAGGTGTQLARYEAAAGDPVPHFRFFRVLDYSVVDGRTITIRTGIRTAWLVQVDEPCDALQWEPALRLESYARLVTVNTSRVEVGRYSCRITEIRPLDMDVLRDLTQST